MAVILFFLLTGVCMVVALRYKNPVYVLIPFLSLLGYVLLLVTLAPHPY
ncbi:hypothetical protein [Bacillus coahuilensis]|nr:hypothetical protein [Bacillus coahuilensis]